MSMSKRIFDILLSSFALFISVPICLMVSVLIWLEDRGPVLFRQKRLGRHGTVFTVYKFRKFSIKEGLTGPNVTVQDDARYSRIGRILEKLKLNELPQLINVLKGDMSCVGPRPELVDYKYCYTENYKELLNFTPGIFGPSQSAFRNETKLYPENSNPETFYASVIFPTKAVIDIQYYKSATVLSDIYWIWRSLVALLNSDVPEQAVIEEFGVLEELKSHMNAGLLTAHGVSATSNFHEAK